MSVVASFEIRYTQFLDETGKATRALPAFASETANLVDLYRWMVLMRTYDAKAVALQRAQIKIQSEPDHDHPSFWSPFLLINNWL